MKKILVLASLSLISCIDIFPSDSDELGSAQKNCDENINLEEGVAFSKLNSDLPVMAGVDELFIDVTYRDFSPHHPDFESFENYNPNTTCERIGDVNPTMGVTLGMVENQLNKVDEFDPSTWKPVKTDGRCASNNLDKWFVDYPGGDKEKHNFTIEGTIALKRKSENSRVFRFERKHLETSDSSGGFYPLDVYAESQREGEENYGKENGSSWCGSDVSREICIERSQNELRGADGRYLQNEKTSTELGVAKGRRHNYNFTTEGFVQFDYLGNDDEVFLFEGDDDIWVFIDGHLVADMGGVHQPKKAEIRLTEIAERAYNEGWDESWLPGTVHTLKFFHAERQTDGSNFVMELTLNEIRPSTNIGPQITYASFEGDGSDVGYVWLQQSLSDETIQKINDGSLAEKVIVFTDTSGVGETGLSQKPTEGSLKIRSFTVSTNTIEEKKYGVKYQFTYDRGEGTTKPKSMQMVSLYFNENPKGEHLTSSKGKPVDAWNYKHFNLVEREITDNEGCE